MSWPNNPRPAKALLTLRQQVLDFAPNRSGANEGGTGLYAGSIGDARHQAKKSDHNPDSNGIVRATDITNDPKNGMDVDRLVKYMAKHPDERLRYIIWNDQIAGNADFMASNPRYGIKQPWTWVPSREDSHEHHAHFSLVRDARADGTQPWDIGQKIGQSPPADPTPPIPLPPNPPHAVSRLRMAKAIIDFEARRDKKTGHLLVYKLPANDGGGAFEVAGINEKYDGPMARKLRDLVNAGKFQEAEDQAQEYIAGNTDIAATWTSSLAVESYLRDCVFNRGAHGAARILQRAVGVRDDGDVGPITRAAIAKFPPAELLTKLRAAREDYERHVVGVRANFWAGLINRWDGALKTAQTFLV